MVLVFKELIKTTQIVTWYKSDNLKSIISSKMAARQVNLQQNAWFSEHLICGITKEVSL